MLVGVLALQGAFREHIACLNKLNIKSKEIRLPEQLKEIDALIIPGGESTTFTKLLNDYKFDLKKFNKPIFGTCAGAIILAKLGLINIKVNRNAYGRQIDSFEEDIEIKSIGKFHAIFIRAPVIESAGKEVEILAKRDGEILMAKQGNILVATFHPELTDDLRVHEYFIKQYAFST